MAAAEAAESASQEEHLAANLAALRARAPYLHTRLSALKAPHTRLLFDEAGGIDLGFRGRGLYGRDAVRHAEEQLAAFFARPLRQRINEPDPERLEGLTGTYCTRLTGRMAAAGIAYDPALLPEDGHFLFVFGVGLGLHVGPLIERTRARVVILIEPNLEFLYQSCRVLDWAGLLARCEERGVKLSFITEREPRTIAQQVNQVARANNPALLDGVTIFSHYPSAILEQARDLVARELMLALSGLGFFEDELTMTRNALGNLGRGPVEILGKLLPGREEPVFIVGSGPSVDQDWEHIARHRDRALLMSIGTGLRGVLARGLRPDFHVELENGEVNLETMKVTAADFDLRGIVLLASLTVNPGLVELFERAVFLFRERVSSTMIFGAPFSILQPAGPTVANTALISAIYLGFREVYLFGVDMGSKAGGRFHARDSVYGAGLKAEVAAPAAPLPGNFGGLATGVEVFNWARKVLENVVHAYPEVRVYNCSDGARIAGAVPKVARGIALDGGPIDRRALFERLSAGLTRCDGRLWLRLWQERDCRRRSREVLERLEAVLTRALGQDDAQCGWIHELYDLARADDLVAAYLAGTLTVSMGCAHWYGRRIADPDQRALYRRLAIEELHAMVAQMNDSLNALFDQVEARLAAA